jgi:hypothetical protein
MRRPWSTRGCRTMGEEEEKEDEEKKKKKKGT